MWEGHRGEGPGSVADGRRLVSIRVADLTVPRSSDCCIRQDGCPLAHHRTCRQPPGAPWLGAQLREPGAAEDGRQGRPVCAQGPRVHGDKGRDRTACDHHERSLPGNPTGVPSTGAHGVLHARSSQPRGPSEG